ncbi:MAG TPA: leucine-rich repeat domain-containing protein, partial [Tenuifilaceae bacterium]|nr:leucine-rich repeat domain-containing protein [Tenuifilaceae bacterium]
MDKTAFMFCAELTSITLPQILETIGERAFESCYKLDYINLPASLTRIGEEAFLGCDGLIAFTVEQGNTAFTAIDGVLFTFDKTSLLYYPFAKTSTRYSIPNTVTRIANMAFNGNYDKVGSLIQIVIPASVLNIGDYAFAERTNLQSIRCKANNAATISMGIDVFINVPKNSCTLYVPTGSKASYQAAPQWQDFTNIVEQDIEIYPVWVGGVQVNEDNASAITGSGIE